jgi:hypothetical protein
VTVHYRRAVDYLGKVKKDCLPALPPLLPADGGLADETQLPGASLQPSEPQILLKFRPHKAAQTTWRCNATSPVPYQAHVAAYHT